MTQKDYVRLAAALLSALDQTRDSPRNQYGVQLAALRIADTLFLDNPRFKRSVFLKACGVE